MRRRIAGTVLLVILTGVACGGGTAEAGDKTPATRVEVVTDSGRDRVGYREIKVNGRTCIEAYTVFNGGGVGLSCDWSAK